MPKSGIAKSEDQGGSRHQRLHFRGVLEGPPFEILKAWQEQRFRLAISLPILQEYRRVLDELTKERAVPALTSVIKIIELHSEMVEPVSFVEPVCNDPDDDKFLAAAIAAGADYVVSGDKALLNVKSHHGVEIARPSRFLKLLFA